MNNLILKNKSTLGESRFSITALINQDDIDKFKLPQDWLDKEITLKPGEWAGYTGKTIKAIAGLKSKDITDVEKGEEPRDPRMIVGLEKYSSAGRNKKKASFDITPVMNSFLYRR